MNRQELGQAVTAARTLERNARELLEQVGTLSETIDRADLSEALGAVATATHALARFRDTLERDADALITAERLYGRSFERGHLETGQNRPENGG